MLIGLICTMTHSFAQSEKPSYKAVVDNFWKNYNDDNVEAIFNMFDPAMQTALPLDKAKSFFSNLKSQAGG